MVVTVKVIMSSMLGENVSERDDTVHNDCDVWFMPRRGIVRRFSCLQSVRFSQSDGGVW